MSLTEAKKALFHIKLAEAQKQIVAAIIETTGLPKVDTTPTQSLSIQQSKNNNYDELKDTIKQRRKALNYTQRDLAIKCGYSQGTITRAEKNIFNISLKALLSISAALEEKLIITNNNNIIKN